MSAHCLDHLVPPSATADDGLREGLARDASIRLGRALRAWRAHPPGPPDVSELAGIAPASGPFRCWLASVEDALLLAQAAERVLAAAPARRRTRAAWSRLIDLVADAGVLARLAPGGRIPRELPARALREARHRLARSRRELAILAGRACVLDGEPEVGELLVERGLSIVAGGRHPGFERRVVKAMRMLESGWPEGAAMLRARTWKVVPVTAWATVSYSSLRQPGIVNVNVNSTPLLRLAEDLVHETTHVRVHELEALHPLVVARAQESSDGTEPRFYSPWRREWRPLRGLVHAVCTFTVGAMFFEKMLAASEPRTGAIVASSSRRRWLARRLLEERASVGMSLALLAQASRAGLLAGAGRRLVAAAAREHRGLARAAARRREWLGRTRAGRGELARLERLVRSLRRQPVRWGWTEGAGSA